MAHRIFRLRMELSLRKEEALRLGSFTKSHRAQHDGFFASKPRKKKSMGYWEAPLLRSLSQKKDTHFSPEKDPTVRKDSTFFSFRCLLRILVVSKKIPLFQEGNESRRTFSRSAPQGWSTRCRASPVRR